jgi:hypothetical protein
MTDYLQPCRRDVRQGRGECCPQHPYLFGSREGGRTVDTLLDECGPEGAYIPEPPIVEPKQSTLPWVLGTAAVLFAAAAVIWWPA